MSNFDTETLRRIVFCLEGVIKWLYADDTGATSSPSLPSIELPPSPPPTAAAAAGSATCGFQDKTKADGIMLQSRRRPKLIPRRHPEGPRYLHPKLDEMARSRVRPRETYTLLSTPRETDTLLSTPPIPMPMMRAARTMCWAAWLITKSEISKPVLRDMLLREELEQARDAFLGIYTHLTCLQEKRRPTERVEVGKEGRAGAAVQGEPSLLIAWMTEALEGIQGGRSNSNLDQLLEKMSESF